MIYKSLAIPTGSLGDHFILFGIVMHYAEQAELVYLPTRPHLISTITNLYEDYPNVIVGDLTHNYPELNPPNIKFFSVNNTFVPPLWDEQFYTHFNLPFSYRYTKFRLPKNRTKANNLFTKINPPKEYAIAHTYYQNSPPLFINSKLPVIQLNESLTDNILDYTTLIANATEIHCVPSSIFHLVDSITHLTNAKLFYYNNRLTSILTNVNNDFNKHRWIIV